MFNINLLNKPGKQEEDTQDNFISFNLKPSDNDINTNKESSTNTSLGSSSGDKKSMDLFSIIIICLIIGIIVSISLGYYFAKLWLE